MILHIFMYNVMSDFSGTRRASEGRINQDLTFLHLSTIYHMTDMEDNQSIASDSTDVSILTVIENDQSQEVDSTPAFTSATALPEDSYTLTMTVPQYNLYSPC